MCIQEAMLWAVHARDGEFVEMKTELVPATPLKVIVLVPTV